MKPLTLLACPKPFTGHVGTIQRNAILSWTRLTPRPRIVLVGDEPGVAEICRELDLAHVAHIERNDRGTPVLASVLSADRGIRATLCCFINADIILMDDFMAAVHAAAAKERFLLVGQRCDLEVTEPLQFADPRWPERLRAEARTRGRLRGEDAIDYFVFSPGLFDPVPPLLVGRAGVDNWLVFRARSRWAPVIDATKTVLAIHQTHDYAHHPEGRHGVYQGDEAQTNVAIAGGYDRLFWISDRTHVMTERGPAVDLTRVQLRRHWDRLPVLVPPPLRPAVVAAQRVQRAVGDALRATGLRKTRITQ